MDIPFSEGSQVLVVDRRGNNDDEKVVGVSKRQQNFVKVKIYIYVCQPYHVTVLNCVEISLIETLDAFYLFYVLTSLWEIAPHSAL